MTKGQLKQIIKEVINEEEEQTFKCTNSNCGRTVGESDLDGSKECPDCGARMRKGVRWNKQYLPGMPVRN